MFYHLSFDKTLEGSWKPRIPAGDGYELFDSQPSKPRISVAPTVEKALLAIYKNIEKVIAESNGRIITLYVYTPRYPTLVEDYSREVWDGHLTDEGAVFCSMEMIPLGKIEFRESDLGEMVRTFPFNDPSKGPMTDVGRTVKHLTIKDI